MAEILGAIHAGNIIHKDINPSNIVYNPETGQVKIIDFGISTVLSRENPTLSNPNVLEGTLAYMSPEQTGRMNRAIDYRTDFYSLGATFYELLTGRLPFVTGDAMELVHCHMAKVPVPPHEVNPQIPKVVSDIVMKLLAKTAEERYQSAWGIKADLEECLTQLQTTGIIAEFTLARQDVSDKFQISQKLYGREAEVETLLAAFERVAPAPGSEAEPHSRAFPGGAREREKGGVELMLVAGYSGIGKSALVQEIYKPITQQRGYFISGKFDQLQRNIPYASLIQAFSSLVRQLLTESEAQVAGWREKLQAALGVNGQVIADVIPEVELILGKQPAVPELGPVESQNRFNFVFQNFLKVFAQPEHPLVIFLDDLQWADGASLKLIQQVMTAGDSQSLLLIGAYRDSEVSAAHPLVLAVGDIEKAGAVVSRISLAALELATVSQLIADTLNCEPERVKPLAELVFQKTGGNPFFMNEFLKSLYAEGLLNFDFNQGGWQWDLEQIQAAPIAGNVVDLMAGKIQKLSEPTQQVLQLAACIGNKFDLKTLSVVRESSQVATAAELWEAVEAGLIVPVGSDYKFLQVSETGFLQETRFLPQYKFVHDRVQQAAYSLIPTERKREVHRLIGELLLRNTPEEAREEKIFDIVNQLNLGAELLATQPEKDELAQLNLAAGKKAKASAAYEPALKYLQAGIRLLAPDSWQTQYHLTLALYEQASELAYVNADFAQMDRFVEAVLSQAKTVLDKVKVYEFKIQKYIAQSKFYEAIAIGLEILKLLGVRLPKKPSKLDVLLGLIRTKLAIGGRSTASLADLPQMTHPYPLASMRILSEIVPCAYFAAPVLSALITVQLVSLSIKWGNAPESAYGYSNYGSLLCGLVGEIESGYQLGKLALNLIATFKEIKLQVRVNIGVYVAIKHWARPANKTLNYPLFNYAMALEIGDLEFAAYATHFYCLYAFVCGQELTALESEMTKYTDAVARLGQERTVYMHKPYHQAVLNLIGQAENPCRLIGTAYSETEMLPMHQSQNDRTVICYLYFIKLMLCYLFGEVAQALANAELAENYLDGITAQLTVTHFHFYDSLARLAVATDAPDSEKKRLFRKVRANQKKMQKWAHHAPANNLHKFYLVEAERYRVLGKDALAMEMYDKAIATAKENDAIAAFQDITERKRAEAERKKFTRDLFQLNQAYERFVPREFLEFLQKKSIVDVQLGDQVQQEMAVLFSDIRDFTALSESMTPADNFKFINSYLSRMEPVIIANRGFIDKYIGDAIMALFSGGADDAVKAGIAMLHRLVEYNRHRQSVGYVPIQIGIGINTGSLMLGTVGGHSRMDGTVISDAVNLASRVEGLTKNYGVSLLITHETFVRLTNPGDYAFRLIGRVRVKGKSEMVSVFEVFDADPPALRACKLATKTAFEQALLLYYMENFAEAAQLFQDCLGHNPGDKPAQIYLERCRQQ